MHTSLFAQNQWQTHFNQQDVLVKSRSYKNNLQISAQGLFNAKPSDFISLLQETSNIPNWVKNVKKVNAINFSNSTKEVIFTQFHQFWPITPRYMLTESTTTQDPESGIITIIIEDSSKNLAQLGFNQKGLIRIKVLSIQWQIIPMDNEQIKIHYLGIVDPRGNIPNWLYKQVSLDSIYKTFQQLTYELQKQNNA